jgi:hypothetical protein
LHIDKKKGLFVELKTHPSFEEVDMDCGYRAACSRGKCGDTKQSKQSVLEIAQVLTPKIFHYARLI